MSSDIFELLALRDFARLVTTFRSGPPGFFRIGWVRRLASLNEFFVHHEDVRKANAHAPRTSERAIDEALWGQRHPRAVVSRGAAARRRSRTSAGRNHPDRPGTARRTGGPRRRPLRRAAAYLFGRPSVAHVEVTWLAAAVEAVQRARFGL
jgi:hypothetical protein